MLPGLLAVLGAAATYLGSVAAAFAMLMRLSLRLLAERGSRSSRLGAYLDDPVQLFLPVRAMLGAVHVAVAVLLVSVFGLGNAAALLWIGLSAGAFILVFEHLLPYLIVRRNPEAVLDALLPSFDAAARLVSPIATPLRALLAARREQPATTQTAGLRRRSAGGDHRLPRRGRAGGAHRARRAAAAPVDRRFRRHAGARSDDAAPRHRGHSLGCDARGVAHVFPRAGVLAHTRVRRVARQHRRVRLHQGSHAAAGDRAAGPAGLDAGAPGLRRARDQAGVGAAPRVPAPAMADRDCRRRIRRDGRPGDARGPARGDRGRDPRRVRRRTRAVRRRGPGAVRGVRQGRHRDPWRAPRRGHRRRGLRDGGRLRHGAPRTRAGGGRSPFHRRPPRGNPRRRAPPRAPRTRVEAFAQQRCGAGATGKAGGLDEGRPS